MKQPLEKKILETAEALFMEKGYDATSTTDIARKVGCNQALVHYYFRTKENLFQRIFIEKVGLILSYITLDSQAAIDFKVALFRFIDSYFSMLSNNRQLPLFLIKELIIREERRSIIRQIVLQEMDYLHYYHNWDKMVREEIEKGRIRPIETMDLTLDVMSLIVFTFISLPLYSDFFQQDEEQITAYLERRRNEIKNLIWKGLQP